MGAAPRLGVGLGPVALLAHEPPETGLVDAQPLLGGHLQGQVDREPVGVVQLERLVTGQLGGSGALRLGHGRVEDRGAGDQRAPERLLLGVGDRTDAREVLRQLRVRRGHGRHADREQLGEHRFVDAEQPHRADGATDDPPQHVAAGLVRRGDAVVDEHQRAADVVGDDAQPDVVLVVGAVALGGHPGRPVEHREHLVDLVEVVHALHQVGDPLEPHPGVDVGLRQRGTDVEVDLAADRAEALLHEHEVPDLQEPVLVHDRTAVGAVLRPAVDVDLAARPARDRGCPCASSCPPGRAAGCAPRAARRPCATAGGPRRHPRAP